MHEGVKINGSLGRYRDKGRISNFGWQNASRALFPEETKQGAFSKNKKGASLFFAKS